MKLIPRLFRWPRSQFDFLRDSRAQIEIVPGDARISLERQPSQNFDVLLVDAFSGDAIPVHLLTRESFELYFRHLKPEGLLAIHVSNKFLDLEPVVKAAARELGVKTTTIVNDADPKNEVYTATWVLVYRQARRRRGPRTAKRCRDGAGLRYYSSTLDRRLQQPAQGSALTRGAGARSRGSSWRTTVTPGLM